MESATAVQTFTNSDFGEIRIVMINSVPWFVGKDVAAALGYIKPKNAIANHVDSEDKALALIQGGCSTGKQNTTIINESGLYSLILSSKMPNAKKFKHWVTSEVIPSIRKHGAYMTPETIEKTLCNPDFIIQLATQLKDEQAKNNALTVENEVLSGSVQTYADRKILNALVRALATNNFRNNFSYAWNYFYKQLRYKYGIDPKIRRGKDKGARSYATYLRDDEVGKAVSLAAALCKENGIDIAKAVNSVNERNLV